jgi:putative phosphoesterase
VIILGVLADTHIPDRARSLNPKVLEILQRAGVQAILHAGDVSIPTVLEELNRIAPVSAVQGNRDIYRLPELPKKRSLSFEGVGIGLTHGHGTWRDYLVDKAYYLTCGIQEERYIRRVIGAFPGAQVVVFGHTHLRLNARVGDKLLFNPGSACCLQADFARPSLGLLRLDQGQAEGEIIEI